MRPRERLIGSFYIYNPPSGELPRRPQGPPRDPPGTPRTHPGFPRAPPGCPGTPPVTPEDPPGTPKRPPGTPQAPPRCPQGPFETPQRSPQTIPRDQEGCSCSLRSALIHEQTSNQQPSASSHRAAANSKQQNLGGCSFSLHSTPTQEQPRRCPGVSLSTQPGPAECAE